MASSYIEIQKNVTINNCVKCGRRPVVQQRGSLWVVLCPNKACENEREGRFVDLAGWDIQNKTP